METIDINGDAPCLTGRMTKGTEWSVLSPEEIQTFNEHVVCGSYDVGEVIFREGDDCGGLYLIEDGLIGVRKIDAAGSSVLVRLAHPGDTLGYRPVLAGENHRSGAEVVQAARVCFLPKAILQQLIFSSPELGAGFLQRTARALGAADEHFVETVTLPARVRLFHLLMVLRERFGHIADDGSLFLDLQLTRRDIASMLGISADSLSRLIQEIEADGIARFSGNQISIANPASLLEELDAGLHSP